MRFLFTSFIILVLVACGSEGIKNKTDAGDSDKTDAGDSDAGRGICSVEKMDCANDSYCKPDSVDVTCQIGKGVCRKYYVLGDSCDAKIDQCKQSICDPVMKKCVDFRAIGESCDPFSSEHCNTAEAYCGRATKECTGYKSVGDDCTLSGECNLNAAYCSAEKKCTRQKENGGACTPVGVFEIAYECKSANCVDNLCADKACS